VTKEPLAAVVTFEWWAYQRCWTELDGVPATPGKLAGKKLFLRL
jgi:hypothetical protein